MLKDNLKKETLALIEFLLEKRISIEIPVFGNSMLPIFPEGTQVKLTPVFSLAELKRGDVVLFKVKERYILHRIIMIGNEVVMCKGDSMVCSDPWVNVNEIVARVVRYRWKNHKLWKSTDGYLFKFITMVYLNPYLVSVSIIRPLVRIWLKNFRSSC